MMPKTIQSRSGLKTTRRTFSLTNVFMLAVMLLVSGVSSQCFAQSVCLPAPRLLTTMPMGAQRGTQIEVKITGDNIGDAQELRFSHVGIKAQPKLDVNGLPVPNVYKVTVSDDCPLGIHEARVMTRLGVSSSRVFNVGHLPESIQETSGTSPANTSLLNARPLTVNSICNAVMTKQSIDFYTFEAEKGKRFAIDCAAKGIDSKLNAVLVVADERGNDLLVERRGGALEFTPTDTGTYVIKVHELTFKGGPHYFYRLRLRELTDGTPSIPMSSTQSVSSFSWPPKSLANQQGTPEQEPNNRSDLAQKIELPCNISGNFYPAADVDLFEFNAKKGEVWWVEVGSERMGLPTDPSIVVQHVSTEGGAEKLTDVIELSDIASPVKVSSNGYSYDGPPYNAGSTDILGKLEIKSDGVHRLRLSDLFGGTRNDPRNRYRLIIRKASSDFSLVGWALHMNLRNGDRNALSKPIALRGGATMAIEVVTIRRDGFNGEIELSMENLPPGVSATGISIPPGKSRGIMLITASEDAPRGLTSASFFGRGSIDGESVTRQVRLASMAWPVPNAWSEVPSPRLLADVPVSVCGSESEMAPLTIAATEDKVWEVTAGQKLTIPLRQIKRCDFSGTAVQLKTFGNSFDRTPAFDAMLNEDSCEAVLDLAVLKTPPGEYRIAFYGSAIAKYRDNPQAIILAELELQQAKKGVQQIAAKVSKLTEAAKVATVNERDNAKKLVQNAEAEKKTADALVVAVGKRVQAATTRAKEKDIVDIIVSTPITIRVKPAEEAK